MSDDKKTVTDMAAVPAWAVELVSISKQTATRVEGIESKVDNIERNQDLQGGELGVMKREMALVFEWKTNVDEKLRSNSIRAKSASEVDLSHETKLADAQAALAEERAKREALEAKAATKEDVAKVLAENQLQTQILDKITGNPMVKRIGQAAAGLALALIALGTAVVYARLNTIQAKTEEHPPPAVIVVPYFDGGTNASHP